MTNKLNQVAPRPRRRCERPRYPRRAKVSMLAVVAACGGVACVDTVEQSPSGDIANQYSEGGGGAGVGGGLDGGIGEEWGGGGVGGAGGSGEQPVGGGMSGAAPDPYDS